MPIISTEHFLDGIIRGPEGKENWKISPCFGAVVTLPQLTSFRSVLSNSPLHHSYTKVLKARTQVSADYCEPDNEIITFICQLALRWCLSLGGYQPKVPKGTEHTATDSAFLYLYPIPKPCCSLGSHRFVPAPSQIKIWVCSGWRSSKHSSVRTPVPFLSTAKWHKLLLPVFQIKTEFSFRNK